jgi:glycosyltransferase involved in cell wall biosynthesis
VKISVVIPAHNESAMIDRCLEAFDGQSVAPHEVIIVDNNSTDDTAQKALKHNNVRVVAEHQQGITFARNTGFNTATGDIIARCDVDTVVSANWIEEIARYFQAHEKIAAVTGPATYYDVPVLWRKPVNWLFLDSFYWITRRSTGGETLFGSNCALRRSVWERVRGEVCADDKNIHEDIDLGQHIQMVGEIGFDDEMRVGISARPLLHPMGMLKRWRKGLNNFSRHKIARAS